MSTYPLRIFAGAALLVAGVLVSPSSAVGAQSATDERTGNVLGPNDQLTIRALDAEEISDKPYRVSSSGDITLPMIGTLKAAGLTVGQLESAVASALEKYIRHPKV